LIGQAGRWPRRLGGTPGAWHDRATLPNQVNRVTGLALPPCLAKRRRGTIGSDSRSPGTW
jgi:hypothetical protein